MSTEETKTVKVEKKVVAKKASVKKAPKVEEVKTDTNIVSEVTTTIADAAKSSIDSVKDTTSKVTSTVSDAATTTTNKIKETYTDIETAINDSKEAGNSRAKKIVAALVDDRANETVVNFFGHLGGISSICATVVCSPVKLATDSANTIYKKITA